MRETTTSEDRDDVADESVLDATAEQPTAEHGTDGQATSEPSDGNDATEPVALGSEADDGDVEQPKRKPGRRARRAAAREREAAAASADSTDADPTDADAATTAPAGKT